MNRIGKILLPIIPWITAVGMIIIAQAIMYIILLIGYRRASDEELLLRIPAVALSWGVIVYATWKLLDAYTTMYNATMFQGHICGEPWYTPHGIMEIGYLYGDTGRSMVLKGNSVGDVYINHEGKLRDGPVAATRDPSYIAFRKGAIVSNFGLIGIIVEYDYRTRTFDVAHDACSITGSLLSRVHKCGIPYEVKIVNVESYPDQARVANIILYLPYQVSFGGNVIGTRREIKNVKFEYQHSLKLRVHDEPYNERGILVSHAWAGERATPDVKYIPSDKEKQVIRDWAIKNNKEVPHYARETEWDACLLSARKRTE